MGGKQAKEQPPVCKLVDLSDHEEQGIFNDLPLELVVAIFEQVSWKDRTSFAQCCKSFAYLMRSPVLLRRVDLSRSLAPNERLQFLIQRTTYLEEVDLFGCESLTNESMRLIGTLSSLRHLRMHGCRKITDAGVACLLETGIQLNTLELQWSYKITEKAVHCIVRVLAGSLRTIGLRGCGGLTDELLAFLIDECPWLTSIDLRKTAWGPHVAAAISNKPDLRRLFLSGNKTSLFHTLPTRCPRLEVLVFTEASLGDSSEKVDFSAWSETMTYLDLTEASIISDVPTKASALAISKAFSVLDRLRYLSLAYSWLAKIPLDDLVELVACLPHLQELDLRSVTSFRYDGGDFSGYQPQELDTLREGIVVHAVDSNKVYDTYTLNVPLPRASSDGSLRPRPIPEGISSLRLR